MTAQAHAAENVHFKEPQPVGVRDVFERLDVEDAKVVDQNINFGEARNRRPSSLCRPKIRCESLEFSRNARFIENSQGLLNPFLGATVYDDRGPLFCQALRDGKADAGSGARNKCSFTFELQIHFCFG
jgi:hypothetical protein